MSNAYDEDPDTWRPLRVRAGPVSIGYVAGPPHERRPGEPTPRGTLLVKKSEKPVGGLRAARILRQVAGILTRRAEEIEDAKIGRTR